MKKYIVSFLMLLALGMGAYAQDARQRTTETIVQDVLAALPSDNMEDCYVQMADLAGAAPASVKYLVSMLQPSDKGANNIFEYAISGLVRYATNPANASVKDAVEAGLVDAVKVCRDKYNRQFLESQLRLMRSYSPEVQEFPKGYNPVDEAKVMIKSPESKEKCKALWIYADNLGGKSAKVLLNALKSEDRAVRTTALYASESFAGEDFYAKVAKMYRKMPAEAKADVLAWFGEQKVVSQLGLVLDAFKEGGEVGAVAVEAAGRIGGEQAAEAIMALVGRSQLSDNAVAALKYIDVDLTDMIVEQLPHAKGERLEDILGLASLRRIGEIAPSVLDYALSSDASVASVAAAALKGVVSASEFDAVAELLDGASSNIPDYEAALQSSLKGMSPEARFNVLSGFVTKAENPERFYGALAETGTDGAVIYLESASENGSSAALEALSSVNSMKVAPILLDAADKDQKYLKRFVDIVEANVGENGWKFAELSRALKKASDNDAAAHVIKALGNMPTMNAFSAVAGYLDDPDLAYTAAGAVKNIASRNADGIDYFVLKPALEKAADVFAKGGSADDGYAVDEIKKILANAEPYEAYKLSDEEKKLGFEVLYDGTDLSKWIGDKVGYSSVNGCIEVTAGYGDSRNLYTVNEYTDFILRFEFCFTRPGVNNGVGIRTPMGVDAAYHGMCEVQVLDHDDPIYEGLREYQVHGSVYGVVPAKRIVHKPLGEWSTEEIRVVGDRVTVTVNGEVIVDADVREACQGHNVAPDGSDKNPYTIDGRNHPGMFNKKGHVGFLGHGEGMKYRNVRILDLSARK